jgi:hypothetical protein
MSKVQELLAHLNSEITPGPVVPTDPLCKALAACWLELDGNEDTGMYPKKLVPDLLEDVRWEPPRLTFVMERHGGTVLGSTRAEVYTYTVDLQERTVTSETHRRYRQLSPRVKPLDTQQICDDVAAQVIGGKKDSRLKWSPDGCSCNSSTFSPHLSGDAGC